MKHQSKMKDILRDLDVKVDWGKIENIVGENGLGERSHSGDTLIQFCQVENLIITTTWFKLPSWKLHLAIPQHGESNIVRNQKDFILSRKIYK